MGRKSGILLYLFLLLAKDWEHDMGVDETAHAEVEDRFKQGKAHQDKANGYADLAINGEETDRGGREEKSHPCRKNLWSLVSFYFRQPETLDDLRAEPTAGAVLQRSKCANKKINQQYTNKRNAARRGEQRDHSRHQKSIHARSIFVDTLRRNGADKILQEFLQGDGNI